MCSDVGLERSMQQHHGLGGPPWVITMGGRFHMQQYYELEAAYVAEP